MVGIIKQATANPLEVSSAVREVLPSITATLPGGMQVSVAHDKSVFIAESIKNVYRTIGEAILLVVLIIFLFLRSVRATLIPLVTIPVSLIGAFALMYALGFSINTLSLLGLVLAKARLIRELSGAAPLVLLDEVAAHLDHARREALFDEILDLKAQAWMTGTDRDLFAPLAENAQIFAVNRGKIGA